MSLVGDIDPALPTTRPLTPNLLDLLQNSLILAHIVPHLPPSSLTQLCATNRAFRTVITVSPGVFRHLDLTQLKAAQVNLDSIDNGGEVWRSVQLDEYLTEEDFYAGPLRGVFATLRRRNILQDVQTLVLDGLSVTSVLVHDIINDSQYSVRLLSIRNVKNLNHGKLRGALQYACRTSRESDPRIKGIYLFGPKDGVTSPQPNRHTSPSISAGWNKKSMHALTSTLHREGDAWWNTRGRIIMRPLPVEWATCLQACDGLVAFDAVLCNGPRHRNSPAYGSVAMNADNNPAVATYSLSGCQVCGKAPEGLVTVDSHSPAKLPLLSPPPIMSSSLRAATSPKTSTPFVPRCGECIRDRYCTGCHKWWCEDCYQLPGQGSTQEASVVILGDGGAVNPDEEIFDTQVYAPKIKYHVTKSCWECGYNCDDCITRTQRVCRKCCAGYCTIHNEGSSTHFCDWCVSRGRGLGRL